MKIGDRVKVTNYAHSVLRGAVGTIVEIGMFIEVKLDDEKLFVWVASSEGIGLFMEDELAPIPET
jgi:hypothetical protein